MKHQCCNINILIFSEIESKIRLVETNLNSNMRGVEERIKKLVKEHEKICNNNYGELTVLSQTMQEEMDTSFNSKLR